MTGMPMGGGMILGAIFLQVIAFAVFMWVLYLVVRAAVRDGVNQSRLGKQPPRGADERGRTEPTL